MGTEALPNVHGRRAVGRPGAVWVLSACLAVAGVAVYFLGVVPLEPLAAPVVIPWWALAIGMFLAECFVVHIVIRDEAQTLSLSELPVVLGLFFTDPVWIVPAHLVGSAAALILVRRQGPKKLSFNLALVVFQSSVAVVVFYALVSLGTPLGWAGWLAALVAVLVLDVLADAAVTAAIALMEGSLEIDWAVVRFSCLVYVANITLGIVGSLVVWTQPGAAWTLIVLGGIPFVAYRSYAALNAEHIRLGHLYRSTRSLLDPKDLEGGTRRLLATLQEMFNADSAELVTFGPGGRGAVTKRLDPDGALESMEPRDLDPMDGVWGGVLLDRQAVLITAPIDDPALREHFEALGVDDAMIAPVFGRGTDDVVGAVSVLNSRGDVGTFSLTGLRLLETVAHQVAVSLENSRLIDELRTEADVRTHQALHDPLTDLPNRRALLERLDRALDAGVAEPSGSLVLLNLDGFQHVNDTLGHGAGDSLLVEVANRLRSAAGDSEFVARIGGDEFVVLRTGSAPEGLAQDLLSAVGAPLRLAGIPIEVTASAGRVRWPDDGTDGVTLLRRADVAMRLAKSARSGLEDYDPERDGFSPERLRLIGEFRGALAEGQLFLVYQPKVSLATRDVTGVEALIRWQHPERGLVPPNEFIPHIEHTALIKPMTEWVIEEAVRQLAEWRAAGHGFSVSVNVPARHVDAGTTLGGLGAFLEGRGIPADRLILEITESGIMADPRGAQEVLVSLRAAGVGLSIDDFGTGFSSLSRLQDLPVTELKIDRSFVMHLTEDANSDSIVRSTIELGHLLGLHVVAEGVETVEQLARLRALGCDTVQGFLFSRPLPPVELEAWIESQALLAVVQNAH